MECWVVMFIFLSLMKFENKVIILLENKKNFYFRSSLKRYFIELIGVYFDKCIL